MERENQNETNRAPQSGVCSETERGRGEMVFLTRTTSPSSREANRWADGLKERKGVGDRKGKSTPVMGYRAESGQK